MTKRKRDLDIHRRLGELASELVAIADDSGRPASSFYSQCAKYVRYAENLLGEYLELK